MPGPEQRKKDQEAKRQAALKHLRATYGEREERKSGASKPKTPVNTNKDNTSTTAEYRALPPVLFTTGHIMKKDSRGTVTILSNNQIMLCDTKQHYVVTNVQGTFQLSFPEAEG